jgi:8-oxo-dGTP pyrophosphatase MutT (NUDIX family)
MQIEGTPVGVPFCFEEAFLTKLLFDPQLMPVQSVAGETAIAVEQLHADWLHQRFANPPIWDAESSDEHLLRAQGKAVTPASVLIPIVVREHGLTVLLTLRSEHLTDHGGQISFPGGRWEESDASPIETALRETEEEVGLDRQHVEVLGTLPDYFTGTGYKVTPVVAIVQPPFEIKADPKEVAEVFEVPLAFLMDGAHHQLRDVELPNGTRRTFYTMPYQRYFIWGATAGMLRNLFHFLRA